MLLIFLKDKKNKSNYFLLQIYKKSYVIIILFISYYYYLAKINFCFKILKNLNVVIKII